MGAEETEPKSLWGWHRSTERQDSGGWTELRWIAFSFGQEDGQETGHLMSSPFLKRPDSEAQPTHLVKPLPSLAYGSDWERKPPQAASHQTSLCCSSVSAGLQQSVLHPHPTLIRTESAELAGPNIPSGRIKIKVKTKAYPGQISRSL